MHLDKQEYKKMNKRQRERQNRIDAVNPNAPSDKCWFEDGMWKSKKSRYRSINPRRRNHDLRFMGLNPRQGYTKRQGYELNLLAHAWLIKKMQMEELLEQKIKEEKRKKK